MLVTVELDWGNAAAGTVEVETPEPLSNSAGWVVLDGNYVRMELVIDAAMKAAGVRKIKTIYGVVDNPNVGPALMMDTNKGRSYSRLDTRPDLAALIANKEAIESSIAAPRKAYHAAKRQIALDKDNALRATMREQAAELEKLIPAGNIRITRTEIADADGDKVYEYIADGTKIPRQDVITHGVAHAIREGAWGAFDSIAVESINPERLAEIRAAAEQKNQEAAEKLAAKRVERDAKFAQAKATGERVALYTFMADCDARPAIECSTDAVTVYAMPDGSEAEHRIHTY